MAETTVLEKKIFAFMESREVKEELKSGLDKARAKEREAQSELLEIMESQDLKSIRHEKFGLITSAVKIFGKIINIDKAKEYFEEKGLDQELFKLTLQKGRLNKLINEMLDEGKVLPEGIGFSPTKYISVRKG